MSCACCRSPTASRSAAGTMRTISRLFCRRLRQRIDAGYRAGIDTSLYKFQTEDREPFTMLFLGSFRHLPNQEALAWFVRKVLPRIRAKEPRARLMVIGSDPPPRHSLPEAEAIELIGFVEDVREPLARYALFVCPILSGSGVRVKLLEAFAAGIPVVSTHLGAEGLAERRCQDLRAGRRSGGIRGSRGGAAGRSGKSGGDGEARARGSGRSTRHSHR